MAADYPNIFNDHMEHYNVEASALHRKLKSKNDALKILRKELEKFRTERDQFKLMAETLQLRYTAIKRNTDYTNLGFKGNTGVANLLNETREKNIKLTTELESSKQKLYELQGDIKILRQKQQQQITTSSENPIAGSSNSTILNDNLEMIWKNEKMNFISHLENLKKKNAQLSFDFKAILDEKEEIVSERDAFKCKAHRLNHELNIALKTNETHPRILDIDGLILENNFLQEKLKNCESVLDFAQQSASKYKSMLDNKRKNGIIKLGTNNIDSLMSHKQVKNLLEDGSDLPTKTETINELKSLCLALLDNLNDKNLALSHQKKTNKILANKIAELEQRIQILSNSAITANGTIVTGNDSGPTSFSPSQMLLNGYNSSNVDCISDHQESKASSNVTEDSGTMSSDESNKTSNNDNNDGIDDSLSTESNHSIISSEYSTTCLFANNPLFHQESEIATISDSLALERIDDLKDLPPEIAELVQKNLHQLDLKEQDDQKIM